MDGLQKGTWNAAVAIVLMFAWVSFWFWLPALQFPFICILGIKWIVIPLGRSSVPPIMKKDELYS